MTDIIGMNFNGDFLPTLIRILVSALFGLALGFERMRKRRGASIRTYMLVCTGSCCCMVVGLFCFKNYSAVDPTRIASQVVSGVGFLGAGTIILSGYNQIRGLTTAAGLWLAACMGLAIGCGYYLCAIIVLVISVLNLLLFSRIQSFFTKRSKTIEIFIVLDNADSVTDLLRYLSTLPINVGNLEIGTSFGKSITLNLYARILDNSPRNEVVEKIKNFDGIAFFEEI